MGLKSAFFGFMLVFLSVGSVGLLPVTAEAHSAFAFTLQESTPGLCWYFGVGFTATEGEQFAVQWSQNASAVYAPVSVDFYIAPLLAVQQNWLCNVGPPQYMYWNDGAYGTANWGAPSTGPYAAVVVNYSQYPISGAISITTPNATLSATPIGPNFVRRQLPTPCLFGCIMDNGVHGRAI